MARIVVASDFSEQSDLAIRVGVNWSEILNCELAICHISLEKHSDAEKLKHISLIKEQYQRVSGNRNLSVDFKEIFGNINSGKDIKKLLLEEKVKIFVLGGESGDYGIFKHPTSENSLNAQTCPLLIARDEVVIHPTSIFWACLGNEASDYQFEWVKLCAKAFSSNLIIGHISSEKERDRFENLKEEHAQIEHYMSMATKDGIETTVEYLIEEQNNIEKSLYQLINKSNCDLTIIGTEGKTGLNKLIRGSVAEELLKKVKSPLLIIKDF